jgi:type II secretory pathway pseudopilin PulG
MNAQRIVLLVVLALLGLAAAAMAPELQRYLKIRSM